MPTCSQAKIITNLESSDLNKRLFRLVGDEIAAAAAAEENGSEEATTTTTKIGESKSAQPKLAQQRRVAKKHDCVGRQRAVMMRMNQQQNQQQPQPQPRINRKISIDDLPSLTNNNNHREATNYQLLRLHKVPIVFGEVATSSNRRLAFNLLNSNGAMQRSSYNNRSSFMNNQMRINTLRSELNLNLQNKQQQQHWWQQTWTDGEDAENEQSASTPTTVSTSSGSSSSCSETHDNQNNNTADSNNQRFGSLLTRKNSDYAQLLPIRFILT